MSQFNLNSSPTYPFTADPGANSFVLSASTTSASGALAGSLLDSIFIYNAGTTLAWASFSKGTVASVIPTAGVNQTGFPVPPGSGLTVSLPIPQNASLRADTVNVILASGTGSVYVTPGTGN